MAFEVHKWRSIVPVLPVLGILGAGCGGGGDEPMGATAAGTDSVGDDAATLDAGDDGGTGGDDGGSAGDGSDDGGDTGAPAGPHALGRIALGELHSANGGTSTPVVTAAFMPDADLAFDPASCGDQVAGCRVSRPPDCADACGEGEYCAFDDGCAPTCMAICDAACDDGEVCYFPTPGTSACKAIERFDAGVLAFSGTTVPLTLFPPYAFAGEDGGALFQSGGSLSVQGSGAAEAGFAAFDHAFTATALLQGDLDAIDAGDAYGEGPMPVSWVPGDDEVTVEVSVVGLDGGAGTVVCEADDAAGSFDVPRAAIAAAVEGDIPSAISVTLRRTRTEVYDDLTTVGTLTGVTVQPVGWLELRTWSAEQVTVEGCGFGELVCGGECVDVLGSAQHCGGCNQPCDGTCQDGTCGAAEDSCVGICGTQAAAGCWCNDQCVMFGDCCPDYATAC